MSFETLHVIGRLKKESKQIEKCGRILGLWVERVQVWPLRFDGIAGGPAPFPVEIQTLPSVADGGPDLAPPRLRPQHVDHHSSAVTAGLVTIELQEAVFPIWKILPVCDGHGPGFSRSYFGESFHKWSHRHRSTPMWKTIIPRAGRLPAAQLGVNVTCSGLPG